MFVFREKWVCWVFIWVSWCNWLGLSLGNCLVCCCMSSCWYIVLLFFFFGNNFGLSVGWLLSLFFFRLVFYVFIVLCYCFEILIYLGCILIFEGGGWVLFVLMKVRNVCWLNELVVGDGMMELDLVCGWFGFVICKVLLV